MTSEVKVENLVGEFTDDDTVTISMVPETANLVPSLTAPTQLADVPTLTPVHSLIPIPMHSVSVAPVEVVNPSPGVHVELEVQAQAVSYESDEPAAKRPRLDSSLDSNRMNGTSEEDSVRQLILTVSKAISLRMDSIENKVDTTLHKLCVLEERIDSLLALARQNPAAENTSPSRRGAVIVGLPQNGTKTDMQQANGVAVNSSDGQNPGQNVTFITLNAEEDFPSGAWLGDESNPKLRVRVPITPSDLLHVNCNCRTAEKMALTLLDYIFDRETQASSNVSGLGKHGKKQLNPLMIYGIRCHLIHRFKVTEEDWHRIKQNIDSKCRTAWRRRERGMPLEVKAFRGKSSAYANTPGMTDISGSDESISQDGESRIQQQSGVDLQTAVEIAGEGSGQSSVQIIQFTAEQLSELQNSQHIQILSGAGGQVLGHLQTDALLPEGCQVTAVTTATGEVYQIQDNPQHSPTN